MHHPLTESQRAALETLAMRACSSFDFGSTTVHKLVAFGYAERQHHTVAGRNSTTIHITPEGLARLGKGPTS
jgi:hypothetical protein